MEYQSKIKEAMTWLSQQEGVVFLGEGLINAGRIYGTLDGVPLTKCLEMPILENLTVGSAVGMAVENLRPVVVFQRMDFLPLAADQIVNHLCLIEQMSGGQYPMPVIIRSIIGSQKKEFDVGVQHNKDLISMFRTQIHTVHIESYHDPVEVYKEAFESGEPILVVEKKDLY